MKHVLVGFCGFLLAGVVLAADTGSSSLIDSPETARRLQHEWAEKLGRPVEVTNPVGMPFRLVPPGRFIMGTPDEDKDAPRHPVTITRPFYLGKHEVTREQWEKVTGKKHSDYYPGKDMPINFITVYDVQAFIAALKKLEPEAAYRLPTEAEWELAARAGTATRYPLGNDEQALAKSAWYLVNSRRTTHPVGTLAANAFGLHDLHGNVWEWCSDYYDPDYYSYGSTVDPTGPEQSLYGYRVLRGGAAFYGPVAARSGNRAFYQDSRTEQYIGFRLVLDLHEPAVGEVAK